MKAKVLKSSIVFTDVSNESQADNIENIVRASKCNIKWSEYHTKAIVTGNLDKFIEIYNK